jgi:hypothetical protein
MRDAAWPLSPDDILEAVLSVQPPPASKMAACAVHGTTWQITAILHRYLPLSPGFLLYGASLDTEWVCINEIQHFSGRCQH